MAADPSASRASSLCGMVMIAALRSENARRSSQNGFATFLASLSPVSGSLYSFQDTGYIALPASLTAMMTPNSLLAVER